MPEKITSLMVPALSDRLDCSPRAQRTASMMLLLPHPLGPAMQVTPSAMGKDVFLAMDLKPLISILFNFTAFFVPELHSDRKLGSLLPIHLEKPSSPEVKAVWGRSESPPVLLSDTPAEEPGGTGGSTGGMRIYPVGRQAPWRGRQSPSMEKALQYAHENGKR